MKPSFWKKLQKPFLALAPMADVTNVALRSLLVRYGSPDVFWTEFVSADGICSPGRNRVEIDLHFEEDQRPIVAQLFTATPEHMYRAGCHVRDLGFNGLDINMGCPDKDIEKQGCGAAMIRNQESALRVIEAAKQTGLPVSVKTRVGYSKEEIDMWIPTLLRTGIDAISVHLRTRKEMSLVPAHWEYMSRIVALRNSIAPDTLIIGNGDVQSYREAQKYSQETGCDGVMIGRGIFGNPWIFNAEVRERDLKEKLQALITYARLFEEKVPSKSFHTLKRQYKAYVQGFDGARDMRDQLMEKAHSAGELEQVVTTFLHTQATV